MLTFEEKEAIIIRLFPAALNNFLKDSPTCRSEIVLPNLSAFVESDINSKTPYIPDRLVFLQFAQRPIVAVCAKPVLTCRALM